MALLKRSNLFQPRDGCNRGQDDRQPAPRPRHGQLRTHPVLEHLPGLPGRRRRHDHGALHRRRDGGDPHKFLSAKVK